MRWIESIAVGVLVSGCAAPGPTRGVQDETAAAPQAYERALEHFTESGKVYTDLETRLLLTATYRGWSLREAYVDYYARVTALDPDKTAELLREERRQWEIYHEVVFLAYTPHTRNMDFDDPDSTWQMYLYDSSDNRTEPVVVRRLDGTTKALGVFYPYMDTSYGRVYVARFPREDLRAGAGALTLQVTGPLGTLELTFDRSGEPTPERPTPGTEARRPADD